VVTVGRIDAGGEHAFESVEIPLTAGATHFVGFGQWDGTGTIRLEIDEGSNGTIDSVVVLVNQASEMLYLPMIRR
jgi:hypothetical protein